MNFLKSIFISGFIMWLAMLSMYSGAQLVRGTTPLLAWLGLCMTTLPLLIFFVKAFLFKSPRTPRHPIEYSLLSSLGLVITLAMSYRYGTAGGIMHVWAGLTLLAWLIYLRWYSVLTRRNSTSLTLGSPLPEFQLETTDGETVASTSFRAHPHLLLFYRGNWCPFCTAQIAELAAAYQRLEALGVTVILISSQSIEKNRKLAAQFDVPMRFLQDRSNTAAKQLGILQSWGTPMGMQLLGYGSDAVLPTVIITDANGDIVFTDQTDNYRLRPEPETFVGIIESLQAPPQESPAV